MNECNVSYEEIIFYLLKGFMVSLLVYFGGSTYIYNFLRPVTLKMSYVICLLLCLSATGCLSAPQSGGVSAKLDWWRDSSFNSASSNYLYTSFREKVITLGQILSNIFVLIIFLYNRCLNHSWINY